MNEMKVAVALTLKKYRLIKDPQHIPKMILKSCSRSLNGIHIKIKPVENDSWSASGYIEPVWHAGGVFALMTSFKYLIHSKHLETGC